MMRNLFAHIESFNKPTPQFQSKKFLYLAYFHL